MPRWADFVIIVLIVLIVRTENRGYEDRQAAGLRPNPEFADWRWNGERWQHHHGYPIGYVDCVHDGELSWSIVGGETGPSARLMRPEWARSVRDQCVSASVPFFFKAWGQWMPTPCPFIDDRENPPDVKLLDDEVMVRVRSTNTKYNHQLDGHTWNEWPA